jgi:2-phospho-L-lactate/phosphoenolpyruvate guanylyltransferase
MSWTAIVPVKPPGLGKTRLSDILDSDERTRLGGELLDCLLRVLREVTDIAEIILLCGAPPGGWAGAWVADRGNGLNAELERAARSVSGRLLVIHADLPSLDSADVSTLLDAASGGTAIAPDRHLSGTNAVAFADARQAHFAFGPDSFQAHRLALPDAAIVHRPGLSHDLDTSDDLAALMDLNALGQSMRDILGSFRGSRRVA